ncbi:hypothetical protein Leryth_006500 [Lithospermum erythrorhizon]|nr:hypothetical protein Leryth_006500 [Lithospermum erythrorhizon]
MQSLGEGREYFLDCVDNFSSEGSFGAEEDLGYGIWMNDPQSVEERRTGFFNRMGLVEFHRMAECSGAVPDSSSVTAGESFVCLERDFNGEAKCMDDEFDYEGVHDSCSGPQNGNAEHSFPVDERLPLDLVNEAVELCCDASTISSEEKNSYVVGCKKVDATKRKMSKWWKPFSRQLRKIKKGNACHVMKEAAVEGDITRVDVKENRKRYKELTAVYAEQNISAHKGLIWTMKFSPDGQFLASGGEDGVVRVWRVRHTDHKFLDLKSDGKLSSRSKQYCRAAIILPEKVMQIEESPLQEFYGHKSDVIDLAWSSSNLLLSSSKDSTVRHWQLGSDKCMGVFKHSNYVTCIQFNPVDENYFITGCIDDKVRIWGVQEKRVVNWIDVHDIITALCYQPDAKGFAVGSISGTCRFYESIGSEPSLNFKFQIRKKRKSTGNRVTGIQFVDNYTSRVMITSEDSKIRILDGTEVVKKYKGLGRSGSQMSASFASAGKHIISVGGDSRIYLWDYDEMQIQPSGQVKSSRACEHFFSDAISVAIPWSGFQADSTVRLQVCSCKTKKDDPVHASSSLRESERFSFADWFSTDSSSRRFATWPEEKLPSFELPYESDLITYSNNGDCCRHQHLKDNCEGLSTTWGLAIVAASYDGTIRTFQNYGLSIKT